jgi:hypothetical protein
MKDGSDAVSDWPLLNVLLNCASGATWVSFHHGGGVGIGFSQHAGMVVVCDGTPEAARRIERVLWNDPASGVMRHADAGYDESIAPTYWGRASDPNSRFERLKFMNFPSIDVGKIRSKRACGGAKHLSKTISVAWHGVKMSQHMDDFCRRTSTH